MVTAVVLFVFALLLLLSETPWERRPDPDVDETAWAIRQFQKRREG